MPPEPASGTLTFLFTDLEGSTRLWEQFPQAMRRALERHDAILQEAIEGSNGQVVKTTGDGLMAVFPSAADGLSACVTAQRNLMDESWEETGVLRVRMRLHSGEAQMRASDYFGPTVNRAARIMAVGHGGQVLLSAAAAALVLDQLPEAASLQELGEHRLKDLGRPERIFQLVHPSLDSDFPPLATLNGRPNNLPLETSTFVGRDAELEAIGRLLDDDAVRLLTLTGPGGSGKTRLALRAAADHIDSYGDGVFFADLSAVRDTESVLAAITRAIGLSRTTDQSQLEELMSQLEHKRVLLILDNFEQVTASATTVVKLLQHCSRLKLLVTSREALRVRFEHLFLVPPLSLPRTAAGHRSPGELARFEAVQLFVERAQAVRPEFDLTNENADPVAEICLRLDGLPLAIELATARINLFSPSALRDRLDNRLQLLRSTLRDQPARQQTLRAAIEWSYELLEPGERRLFELLSVFSSTELEAVEAVASEIDWLTETGLATMDGMASLLDKSLIRRTDTGEGEPRLAMLETIKEYAAERLHDTPGFYALARRAHAAYFAEFAHGRWEQLTGQRYEPAQAEMAADLDNLRIAWRYWVGEGDLGQLNKLADSLWLLYDFRGWYHATIELTTDLLNVLSSSPSTPERAIQEVTLRTSLARALMAIKGYTPEVEEAHTRALKLFEGAESAQLFPVLRSLASFYNFRAEFDKGAQVGRQIIRLAEQQNDTSMLVDGYLVLGANLAFLNDLHAGLEHLDKAIGYFRSGVTPLTFIPACEQPRRRVLHDFRFYPLDARLPDRALRRADDAVALATELEHPFTLAYGLFHSGFLHLWRREPGLVRDRALGVLQVAEDHEFQIWRAVGTCLLGAGNAGLGLFEEGLAQITEGLDLYQGLKTPPVFWPLLLFVQAGAYARAGRPQEGLAVIDEAIEIAARGTGMTLLSEFHLLKGDLLLALPEVDGAGAEAWLQQAFDVARGLDARMSQLRAAVRLCRLWRSQGSLERADRVLRNVYDTFTEGFTTSDLIGAKSLLEGLS